MQHQAPRRVSQARHLLVEGVADVVHRQDSQLVLHDGHKALGALVARKRARVVERVVRQRRQRKAALVGVAQPRAAAERQHAALPANHGGDEPRARGAEEARARIAQLAGDLVDLGAHQHAVLQTDVEEQAADLGCPAGWAVAHSRCVKQQRADGVVGHRLEGEVAQAVVRVEAQHLHGQVCTSDDEEARAHEALRHRRHVHAQHLLLHLALALLQQQAHRVQLKIDDLATRQGDDDLLFVGRRVRDGTPSGHLPLVDAAVRADVP
mmetsp:Transcript_6929/g.21268  ORF Transcript_6929/g.21268 Transcript_6929/m.21268 type:complete len:266 (-) Transcript_6929:1756-2553(-)